MIDFPIQTIQAKCRRQNYKGLASEDAGSEPYYVALAAKLRNTVFTAIDTAVIVYIAVAHGSECAKPQLAFAEKVIHAFAPVAASGRRS